MKKTLDHNILTYFMDFLMAYFTALSLLMSMKVPELEPWQSAYKIAEVFWNFKVSLAGKGNIAFIVCILLFLFYKNVFSIHRQNAYHPMLLVNIVLSVIWLMSEGYRIDNSLHTLTCSTGQIVKSSVYFLGTFWGLEILSSFVYFKLSEWHNWKDRKDGCYKKAFIIYSKRPFIIGVGLILMAWLPHIIIAYPGYFCADAFNQLSQYFGFMEWSSHHPPFCTFMMGRIIELGLLINDYLGPYLFILIQAVLAAMIISYGFGLLVKMNTPYGIMIVYAISVIFVPYYTDYVCMFLKDDLYSYSFLLMSIELIHLLIDGSEIIFTNKKHILLWIAGFSGLLLFRNNGVYVGLPLFIVLVFNEIHRIRRRQINITIVRKDIVIFTLPFIITGMIGTALNSYYDIQEGSIREALSLPMQQTARYVKEYGNEVTEEEKTLIQAVLPYSELEKLYDPRISDPIKREFKTNPSRKELIDYLNVWKKQLFKHPLVYTSATLNQNYYCFYPFISNDMCYVDTFSHDQPWPKYDEVKSVLKIKLFRQLDPWKERIYAFYRMCFEVPGLNLLSHPAFYNILIIWLVVFAVRKRLYSVIMTAMPLLLSLMIIILAPVIQGSPRYAFPIIFTSPYLLSYYLYCDSESDSNNKTIEDNNGQNSSINPML